ncbi:MAG: hypothetical protein H0U64_10205 [Gemmatimonadaceae bacterium]|nr:hypothetical protein [Gemmatimonadaceae bacterium]
MVALCKHLLQLGQALCVAGTGVYQKRLALGRWGIERGVKDRRQLVPVSW